MLKPAVNRFIMFAMKSSPQSLVPRKLGRPLSFDRNAALEAAMLLFWRHGYEGTSLSELTTTMGITPPSLYTAFGDKKRLFLEAVDRYLSGPITSDEIIEKAPTARQAAWGLLHAAAFGFTGHDTPAGCLLASSAISGSSGSEDVQGELATLRRAIEAKLRHKVVTAMQAGELAAGTDADALAGHVTAVIQGLSTLARDGATREKLLRVAEIAISAWPPEADVDEPSVARRGSRT